MQTKPDSVAADLLFDMVNQRPKGESAVASTTKWEYDFVIVSDMGPTKFVQFLQDRENRGWEFNGQVSIVHDGKPGAAAWMFRRPRQSAPNKSDAQAKADYLRYVGRFQEAATADAHQERIKQLEAEIARLKGHVGDKTPDVPQERIFKPEDLPLGVSEMADILRRLALKRYGYERLSCIVVSESNVVGLPAGPGSRLALRGDKESVDWAAGIISALMKK
jgi:hypothetical protein